MTNLNGITEHTFSTEYDAKEAWTELDRFGRQRNNGATVAFREGRRVYLRPEWISAVLMRELAGLAMAF